MKRTFTIETDQPDEEGTVIKLHGIIIPERIPLLYNFKYSADNLIAFGRAWVEGGELKCEADIDDFWLDAWPGIGFTVNNFSVLKTGRLVKNSKLYCVGLCNMPNLNSGIKTIREQLQTKSPL